ncbi:hypothetical protein ACQFYA_10955 [Promicromonospora sp. Marseille-Q5078]
MTARFEGRAALVTGGAHGIGAATVRRPQAEGASVVVADLDPAGPARCVRAAAPHLPRGGAIVPVGSMNGLQAFGDEDYSAAKAPDVAGAEPRGAPGPSRASSGSAAGESGTPVPTTPMSAIVDIPPNVT